MTSEAVVDMINGKTAEEIHKMFNLKEDFTFKEMEVVMNGVLSKSCKCLCPSIFHQL